MRAPALLNSAVRWYLLAWGMLAVAEMLPFLNGRSFDPETTRIMGDAFDKVSRDLHDRGQPAVVQELIAKRIIDLAATGVRDPEQLAQQALRAFGIRV